MVTEILEGYLKSRISNGYESSAIYLVNGPKENDDAYFKASTKTKCSQEQPT
jgi:hypothetical protein